MICFSRAIVHSCRGTPDRAPVSSKTMLAGVAFYSARPAQPGNFSMTNCPGRITAAISGKRWSRNTRKVRSASGTLSTVVAISWSIDRGSWIVNREL